MRVLLFPFHAAVATLKMAGDVIASILWRSNVYGAIMSKFLFDSIELNWWSSA